MLTIDDIITSSGRYPERADSDELTDTVRENIVLLISRVNPLLEKLEMAPLVSSGFRPKDTLKSQGKYHPLGMAVDLKDPSGALKFKIIMNPHLLAEYGLWMENHTSTPGWCHLDIGQRPDRAVRIFKP